MPHQPTPHALQPLLSCQEVRLSAASLLGVLGVIKARKLGACQPQGPVLGWPVRPHTDASKAVRPKSSQRKVRLEPAAVHSVQGLCWGGLSTASLCRPESSHRKVRFGPAAVHSVPDPVLGCH